MKALKIAATILLSITCALLCSCTSTPPSSSPNAPSSSQDSHSQGPDPAIAGAPTIGDAHSFKSKIEEKGYYVQEGRYQEFDTLKLASEGQLISCFGNNQGSAYLTNFIPPAPNQSPAKAPKERSDWADEQPSKYYNIHAENYPANPFFSPVGWSYKLAENEAIVIVGETPPECTYFSFINYVLFTPDKPNKDYTHEKGYFQVVDSAGTAYHPVFGSMGSPCNIYNISTEKTPNHAGGNSFGAGFVMVTTGSNTTYETVVDSLLEAGFSQDVINEMPLPTKSLNMGLETGKDTFCLVARVSQPTDREKYQQYVDGLSDSFRVYRVTPKQPHENEVLYNSANLVTRGSNISETSLIPHARNDLDAIRQSILEKYSEEYTYQELTSDIAVPEGMTGYQNDQNCQGDNRDTSYLMTEDFTLNSDEDFIVLYGINHVKTQKAVYANAILYSRPMLNGVTSIYDGLFEGSARQYLPASSANNSDSYYVYNMARTKMDEYTALIDYSTDNEKGRFYGVDNGQTLLLAYRAYIEKATGVAPSYYEMIYDRAIVFHKK